MGAFVHIELFLAKKPIHKSLWLQGDGFVLNLFRLCLDAWTGFSHKNPSAQASQRGGRAGSPNEGACPEVRAKQKTFTVNY